MLAPALCLQGLRGSCVCTSRGKPWMFYPAASCFSGLLLSKERQPCLPFHLSLSFMLPLHPVTDSAKGRPRQPRPAVEVPPLLLPPQPSHPCPAPRHTAPCLCACRPALLPPWFRDAPCQITPPCHLLPGCLGHVFTKQDGGLGLCCGFPGILWVPRLPIQSKWLSPSVSPLPHSPLCYRHVPGK